MSRVRVTLWDRFLRAAKKPVWYAVHALSGQRLAMPVHYLDMSMFGAVFRVPGSAASALVPRDLFVPDVDDDGNARVHVTALEYRLCDILYPYCEVAVTVAGRLRRGQQEEAHYYLHLPVTTDDACWTGVGNYGFPKFVAEISFSLGGTMASCTLSLDGDPILELTVGKAVTTEEQWLVRNLTVREGTPILSEFTAQGQRGDADTAGGASVWFGTHPIGRELAALGIEGQSLSHFYCPQMCAVLSKPIVLGSTSAP